MAASVLKKCCEGQCKLNRILEAPIHAFPGNASLSQFLTVGFSDGRINGSLNALIHEEKKITFNELEAGSERMAEVMCEMLGSSKNSNPDGDAVIAICLPTSVKLIVALFAIHKMGAAYVPIDISFSEDRLYKIVKDCKPLMVISDSHTNFVNKFEIVKEHTKVMTITKIMERMSNMQARPSDAEIRGEGGSETDDNSGSINANTSLSTVGRKDHPLSGLPLLAERTAVILYKTGSYGELKGVRLTHRTVMNRLSWQWSEFPYLEDEKCVWKEPITSVDSVTEIFAPLLQGIPIIIFYKHIASQPGTFIRNVAFHEITRVTLMPSFLKDIFRAVEQFGKDEVLPLISSVKIWICSGEPLSYDLFCEFFELFPRKYTLANFYGAAEVMGDVCFVAYRSRMEAHRHVTDQKIPLGVPINNSVIYIMDPDMNMLENGAIGEIYIAGYNVAKTYVGGAVDEKFVENPYTRTASYSTLYKTGDFGQISASENGTRMLYYEGRADSQVKILGDRVDLLQIELKLSEIALISRVVVLAYQPDDPDQAVVAFVVKAEPTVTLERLEPLVKKRLLEYEIPEILFAEQIPTLVNGNGKIDRQRMLKMYENELHGNEEDDVDWDLLEVDLSEEKMPLAKILFNTISEVTGTSVETLAENLDNSFFNVGGTAMNAVEVVVKLREQKWNISVADFAAARTIRHMIFALAMIPDEKDNEKSRETESSEDTDEQTPAPTKEDAHGSHSTGPKYSIDQISEEDKEDVVHTIAYSFSHKGELEAYTKAGYEEFRALINSIWGRVLQQGFSLIVRTAKERKCAGVCLNLDFNENLEQIDASPGIRYALELVDHLESQQKSQLPSEEGKVLHNFMMGYSEDIDESECVAVFDLMDEKTLELAAQNNFEGVIATATNALTKQICVDIHGYELVAQLQANEFIAADYTKPFFLAPDSLTIACCYKELVEEAVEESEEAVEGSEEAVEESEEAVNESTSASNQLNTDELMQMENCGLL